MVAPGTLPPKDKQELLHPPTFDQYSSSGPIGATSISALQGRIGVPPLPRTQFSSGGRDGIFGLSAPSHEAHGGKSQFPSIHRRPLSERSEEQKQEVHNLMLRLSGNPFPHDRPDAQNNGLRLAEDRGRLVVHETDQFVSPEKGRWRWKDQESKQDHSDRRMLWAQGTQKESLPSATESTSRSIWSLPSNHVEWQTATRDTAPLADRQELSLKLAAERRSERAVQRNRLGGCATGRRFNRTEGREEFWNMGEYRKDGPQPEWSFPHGYDSSRSAGKGISDPADKKWADGLLLEDMVRAKYGTDAGRLAQASLKIGGHAHTGLK